MGLSQRSESSEDDPEHAPLTPARQNNAKKGSTGTKRPETMTPATTPTSPTGGNTSKKTPRAKGLLNRFRGKTTAATTATTTTGNNNDVGTDDSNVDDKGEDESGTDDQESEPQPDTNATASAKLTKSRGL